MRGRARTPTSARNSPAHSAAAAGASSSADGRYVSRSTRGSRGGGGRTADRYQALGGKQEGVRLDCARLEFNSLERLRARRQLVSSGSRAEEA